MLRPVEVKSQDLLEKVYAFYVRTFKTLADTSNPVYSLQAWQERMKDHSSLMICLLEDEEVVGMAFGRLSGHKRVTLGPIGVHEKCRKRGLASLLVADLERRARHMGIESLELGALESGQGFYERLGYQPALLIQSSEDSLDSLSAFNTAYPLVFKRVYEGSISQVCLKMDTCDNELRKAYEAHFPAAYTMIYYEKNL